MRCMQVWRLLAQLVHEPDKRMPGSGLALRRAGETASGSNSFNLLATQLMNLTSPGTGRPVLHIRRDAESVNTTHIHVNVQCLRAHCQ